MIDEASLSHHTQYENPGCVAKGACDRGARYETDVEFYDVRDGAAIVSSHKTLYKARVVQQEEPSERRVVLTSLDGTKWCDLRGVFLTSARQASRVP
jgi:hypothetical protein